MSVPASVLQSAREVIARRFGLDFEGAQAPRLVKGLGRALREASVPAIEAQAYLNRLGAMAGTSEELMRLAAHFTVGETYFFREPASFAALEQTVLPELMARRRRQGANRLRLWSAGCATGEEPYSLAILLDRLLEGDAGWDVCILATDINLDALKAARRGRYREWSLRATEPWIRGRYFTGVGNGLYELDPRVRRMVTFAPLNLAGEGGPLGAVGGMDVVLCRNVLMYFTPQIAERTLQRLQAALTPGGWLVTSPAEASADRLKPLEPINFPGAIVFRRRSDPPAPALEAADAPDGGAGASAREAARPDGRQDPAPPDVHALVARARSLADRGRLREARRACEAALAQDALHPDAYLLLATISQEQGDSQAALNALRRTLYLVPDSGLAHFLLGALHFRRGERSRGRSSMAAAQEIMRTVAPDQLVPGSDGLRAGRLLEAARAYLELHGGRAP